MKTVSRILVAFVLVLSLLQTSCRKEEFEFVGTPPEDGLSSNSTVANLLIRTTLKDGSIDNIVDGASCFSVALPLTVIANGNTLTITDEDGYDEIEFIFEERDDDDDTLEIIFPVTLIFADYTEEEVSNQTDFDAFVSSCGGENQVDDDIECIDLIYPVALTTFNTNSERFNSFSIVNDKVLFNFITNLDKNDVVDITFPLNLLLSNGDELQVFDLQELENSIADASNDCDEDDDNNFDDDDCQGCSEDEIKELFLSCDDWIVDSLRRDNMFLQTQYEDLSFHFQENDILVVTSSTETFTGNWFVTEAADNIIQIEIVVPGLEDFNGVWDVNEVALVNSQGKVNLLAGNDRLRFANNCSN